MQSNVQRHSAGAYFASNVAAFVWPFTLALPFAKHVQTSVETGIVPAANTAAFAEGDSCKVLPVAFEL